MAVAPETVGSGRALGQERDRLCPALLVRVTSGFVPPLEKATEDAAALGIQVPAVVWCKAASTGTHEPFC